MAVVTTKGGKCHLCFDEEYTVEGGTCKLNHTICERCALQQVDRDICEYCRTTRVWTDKWNKRKAEEALRWPQTDDTAAVPAVKSQRNAEQVVDADDTAAAPIVNSESKDNGREVVLYHHLANIAGGPPNPLDLWLVWRAEVGLSIPTENQARADLLTRLVRALEHGR